MNMKNCSLRTMILNKNILVFTGFVFYCLMVLGPIASLCIEGLDFVLLTKAQVFLLSSRQIQLLINSIFLSLSIAVTCVVIGILVASFLLSTKRTSKLLRYCMLIMLLLPPYVHAISWSSAINNINEILLRLGMNRIRFQDFGASFWVEVMAYLPIAVLLTLLSLKRVDGPLIDAGRIINTNKSVFLKIVLKMSYPTILAGGGLIFVLSIIDYCVPSIYQFSVYALEIFAEYSSGTNPAVGMLVSAPLLITTVFILWLTQQGFMSLSMNDRQSKGTQTFKMPFWFGILQKLALIVIFLQIAVPLLTIILHLGQWKSMVSSCFEASSSILNTIVIAFLSATISLIPAYFGAKMLSSNLRANKFWWFILMFPAVVPAPLIGIGLISMWNHPNLSLINNSILMPVLGSLARFTPFAVMILASFMRNIDTSLIDSARILQKNSLVTLLKVKFPLLLPGITSAFCGVFILTVSELGSSVILVPPGYETVTIRIYNYLHYGASEKVLGLSFFMILLPTCLGLLAATAVRTERRWFG